MCWPLHCTDDRYTFEEGLSEWLDAQERIGVLPRGNDEAPVDGENIQIDERN